MIQILNNVLFYFNIAALLHHQALEEPLSSPNLNGNEGLVFVSSSESIRLDEKGNVSLVLQQIPPGLIEPGVVVKFVCSAGVECGESEISKGSYQWEMHQYTADQNGRLGNESVVKLQGQDSEMELEFNKSISDRDPTMHCDLVCSIPSNPTPTIASIKLQFQTLDKMEVIPLKLEPPKGFSMLDVSATAVYFTWNLPRRNSSKKCPQVTGYIIEYKNGRGMTDWKSDKVSKYVIEDGNSFSACISNLNPWSRYDFRIIAVSHNISSQPSSPIIVLTKEALPAAAPVDVKVIWVENNNFQVSWKPPPRSTWNGSLLGYNIGFKRATDHGDDQFQIHVVISSTLGNPYIHQIKIPDPSLQYKVVVRTFNNIGNGPFSNPVTLSPT